MAKKEGRYYRLAVGNGASPEVFTEVAGQRDLDFNPSPNFFDTSSKADYPYGTQGVGRRTLDIRCTGVQTFPDTNGLEALITADNAGTPVNVRILNTLPSPSTTVFEGSVNVQIGWTYPDEGPAEYAITLTPAVAPTTVAPAA